MGNTYLFKVKYSYNRHFPLSLSIDQRVVHVHSTEEPPGDLVLRQEKKIAEISQAFVAWGANPGLATCI